MRGRAAGLTEDEQKERYLAAFARIGTLTAGCRAAHCSPNTVYKWREHDETFSFREEQARTTFADRLEEEAYRRAYTGTVKPIFQNGRQVGDVREFDTTLLVLLLKAVRPDKYRERASIDYTHAGGGGGAARKDVTVSDDDLRAAETAFFAALGVPGAQPRAVGGDAGDHRPPDEGPHPV